MSKIKEMVEWLEDMEIDSVGDFRVAYTFALTEANRLLAEKNVSIDKVCESCEGHGVLFMPINDTNTYAKGKCPDCNGTGEKEEE